MMSHFNADLFGAVESNKWLTDGWPFPLPPSVTTHTKHVGDILILQKIYIYYFFFLFKLSLVALLHVQFRKSRLFCFCLQDNKVSSHPFHLIHHHHKKNKKKQTKAIFETGGWNGKRRHSNRIPPVYTVRTTGGEDGSSLAGEGRCVPRTETSTSSTPGTSIKLIEAKGTVLIRGSEICHISLLVYLWIHSVLKSSEIYGCCFFK